MHITWRTSEGYAHNHLSFFLFTFWSCLKCFCLKLTMLSSRCFHFLSNHFVGSNHCSCVCALSSSLMTCTEYPYAPQCRFCPRTPRDLWQKPSWILWGFTLIIFCTYCTNYSILILSKHCGSFLTLATVTHFHLEATNSFWTLCTNGLATSKKHTISTLLYTVYTATITECHFILCISW